MPANKTKSPRYLTISKNYNFKLTPVVVHSIVCTQIVKSIAKLRSPFMVPSALRLRIIFFLAITVMPLSCLSFYLALDERHEEDARARAEEKAVVREVTTDLDRLFQLSRSLVTGISYQNNPTSLCASLDAMGPSFPAFLNLGLYEVRLDEKRAESICGLATRGQKFALTQSEDRIAVGLRTRGDIAVAPVRVSVRTGKPVIPIMSLVEDEPGRIRRMVSVSVNLGVARRSDQPSARSRFRRSDGSGPRTA